MHFNIPGLRQKALNRLLHGRPIIRRMASGSGRAKPQAAQHSVTPEIIEAALSSKVPSKSKATSFKSLDFVILKLKQNSHCRNFKVIFRPFFQEFLKSGWSAKSPKFFSKPKYLIVSNIKWGGSAFNARRPFRGCCNLIALEWRCSLFPKASPSWIARPAPYFLSPMIGDPIALQ